LAIPAGSGDDEVLAFLGSNTLAVMDVGLGVLAALLLAIVFYALIRRQKSGFGNSGEPDKNQAASQKGQFGSAFEAGRQAYREAAGEARKP
jgi:hypothetical protein